ncbi:dTDP-4-dehydrorhamnose reductase [Ideonella azotifigens]|uniref:dTDP-4-dehydrorhamnose reductase n=1 Tax=Ideonella azotifigens TaxID=513160 RepID=A0ABN1JKP6_9BURK|nr:dTDP-4-dehydrorhamnose reductase [Ideonella azotifigens]MCD2339644.1 dTDP-4-dehydrorhamnose reductase [Ideonella azotifigens]
MNRILLLGPNGQVGWELQRALAPLGELHLRDRHQGGDLADADALAATVRELRPDVIVNAAAHTAVDKAESEPALASRLNAQAPAQLAELALALGATLVHYSTDYVFDGSGDQPRDETSATGPLSVYGATKLAGEQAIQASGCRHLIFRTSWVYAARGGNFAKTMLRLAAERDQLKVVADQVGAPTGAELLADISAHALRRLAHQPDLPGLYHLCASGETSWHGYAAHVIEWARRHGKAIRVAPDQVLAIPTQEFPLPAPRPLNSRLDTTKLQTAFGLRLPRWQVGVDRMLAEILA